MKQRNRSVCRLTSILVVAIGLFSRILLPLGSPTPYGYVFDFYHEGVIKYWVTGRLPVAADCWQCYHPPFFYVLGVPFYAFGSLFPFKFAALRGLSVLPLICGMLIVWLTTKLLHIFQIRGISYLCALGVIVSVPCLFISSYGIEGDILVSLLLVFVLVALVKYFSANSPGNITLSSLIGVFCGGAAATKYNGLIGLATTGMAMGILLVFTLLQPVRAYFGDPRTFRRDQGSKFSLSTPWRCSAARIIRDGIIVLVLAFGLGGWKYVENYKTFKQPMFANGTASQGLSLNLSSLF